MTDDLIFAGAALWMLAVVTAYVWFFKHIQRRFPNG